VCFKVEKSRFIWTDPDMKPGGYDIIDDFRKNYSNVASLSILETCSDFVKTFVNQLEILE